MRSLPNYQLLEFIGRGGQSEVYRAIHLSSGQEVAIKFLKQSATFDPADLARFEREITIARTLNHPGIVKVIDVVREPERLCVVMELLKGESLHKYLTRKGRITYAEFKPLLRQIVDVLDHCHSKNIIHRDIKPHNIVILGSGEIRIIDFGISKFAGVTSSMTQSGLMLGTPNYMAPERFFTSISDARSDIFSVGVLIFKALTGQYPHEAADVLQLATQKAVSKVRSMSEIVPGIPIWFDKIVTKMLQPQAINRYQTMSDLKIDLDAESFFEMKPSSIAQIECYVCDESTSPDFGFCFRCGADFRASKNEEGSHSVWVVRSGGQPHWPKFFSEVGARPVPIKLGRTWRKLIGGIPKDLAEMIVAKAARCEIHARVQRDTFRAYLFNFKGVVLTGILIAIPAVPILFLSLLAVAFYAYDLIVEFHKSNLDLFSYLQNAIYNTFFYPSRFRGGTLKPQVLQLLGMYTVISGIIAVWLSSAWRVAKRPMIEGWAQNTSSFLSELPQTKIVLRSLKQDESRRWVKKIFDAFNTLYVRTPETEIGARRNLKDLYKVQLQLLKCHDVALARWQHSQKSSLEEMFAAEDSFQAISTRLIRVQMTVETEIRKKLMPQKTKEQGADIAAQIADTAAYVDAYRQLQSGSEAA